MQFTAKVLKVLVCVVLGLTLSGPALAWNDRGHMTVAFIAYKQLTPTTRDRVNALLKLNPKYSDWSATVDKQAPGSSADDKKNGAGFDQCRSAEVLRSDLANCTWWETFISRCMLRRA